MMDIINTPQMAKDHLQEFPRKVCQHRHGR
jgi:hypothetical protein